MHIPTKLVAFCALAARLSLTEGRHIFPRQATDPAGFSAAITALLQTYLPSSAYSCALAAIPTAAPSIPGPGPHEPIAVLVSALAAEPEPTWLTAVFHGPNGVFYHSVLASEIELLRPTGTAFPGTGATAPITTPFPTTTATEATVAVPSSSSEGETTITSSRIESTGATSSSGESASATETGIGGGDANSTSSSNGAVGGLPTPAMADLAAVGVIGLVGLAVAL